jgi:CRISPR system Cascade subunit CasD
MANKYVLLWLEAPLQSWGADSKFGRRDTLPFPTKSGITGLLLCAMGASGDQCELLEALAPLGQTVVSFARTRSRADGETMIVDREPMLRDFHMVGSGYDNRDPWQSLLIPKTAEGKPAVGGGTKLTYRYYLQDARFAAVVELPPGLAERIGEALTSPVFDMYLGRKSCVPTDIVLRGVFNTEDEALAEAAGIAQGKGLREEFRVVDGEHEGERMTLNDVPLRFGVSKRYRDRRVTLVRS